MTNHEKPGGGSENDVAARMPDPEKQAALTTQGYWLTKWVYDGRSRLVNDGIIQEALALEHALRGVHELFTPGPSPIEGGWRRINGERGMRLTVLHPTNPQEDPSGYTEFELADLTIIVGSDKNIRSEAAEVIDRVRIDVRDDGTCHVSGTICGTPFNVDNPNPETSFADLDAAEMLLGEAQAGLDFLAPGLTNMQPPQAPTVSAQ